MAYAPKIKTLAALKTYVLSKLGAPVVNIEVDNDQLDNNINDTLEQYMEVAYAGMLERYIPIKLLKDVQEYVLPYEIFAVLNVHSSGIGGVANSTPSNIFSINQFIATDLYRGNGKIDLLTYEMTNQMLSTLEIVMGRKITFDFNSISKVLHVFSKPTQDENVLLHVYKKNVPTYTIDDTDPQNPIEVEDTNIYDNRWVKRMAIERVRYQWATNLGKYSGSALPNGLVLDVPTMLGEAKENITKLEEELETEWKLPCDFFIA